MSIHASPGVYAEIKDFSSYVSQLSSTTLALIGKSEKGPTIPTFISSVRQFTDTFGLPTNGDYSALAAISYLEYGNSLWYKRIVGDKALKAKADIPTAKVHSDVFAEDTTNGLVKDSDLFVYSTVLEEEPIAGTVSISITEPNSTSIFIKDKKVEDINKKTFYGRFDSNENSTVTDNVNYINYNLGNFRFQLQSVSENDLIAKYITKSKTENLDYNNHGTISQIVSENTIHGFVNWVGQNFKSSIKKSSFEVTVYSKEKEGQKHIYKIYVDDKGEFKCVDIYNGLNSPVTIDGASLDLISGEYSFTFTSPKLGDVERILIDYTHEQFKWVNLGKDKKSYINYIGNPIDRYSLYIFSLDTSMIDTLGAFTEALSDEFSKNLIIKDDGNGKLVNVVEETLVDGIADYGFNAINYNTKEISIALSVPLPKTKTIKIEYMAKSTNEVGILPSDKIISTTIDKPIIKNSLSIYIDGELIAVDDGNGNIISKNKSNTSGTVEYAKLNQDNGNMYAEIDFVYGGDLSEEVNANKVTISYIASMGVVESLSYGESSNNTLVEFYQEDFRDVNNTTKYYGLNIWNPNQIASVQSPSENFRKFVFDNDESVNYFTNVVASTNVKFTIFDTESIPVLNNKIVLTGGFDDVDNITVNTAIKALDDFSNYETYDINLIAVPDFPGNKALALALIDLCENKRGDCFALIDPPKGLSPQNVVAWHNGDGIYSSENALNSKQASLYYPWIKINNQFTESIQFVPPSVKMVSVFAYSDNNSEVWFAPAGLNRGRVFKALELERRLTVNDRDLLYSTGTNAINPICDFVGDGIVVYGQKTLQRKPSALDRINAVRLVLYVTKILATSTKYLLFEPHDKLTWERYVLLVKPFLEDVKLKRGVYDYTVKCDETTNTAYDIDNNTMVAEVSLQPTKVTERIITRFKITGASTTAIINE